MSKEKKYFRKIMLALGLVLVVYLIVQTGTNLLLGKEFTTDFYVTQDREGLTLEDINVQALEPDIVNFEATELQEDSLSVTLTPLKKGKVTLEAIDKDTGECIGICDFSVTGAGLITNMNNADFTNCRISIWYIVLVFIAFAVILWGAFFETVKNLKYSYQSIFCYGLGIWVTIIAMILLLHAIKKGDMMNVYSNLESAANTFVILSFPVMAVFSLLLAFSNICLIRHEGFRIPNALGIGVAGMLMGGFLVLAVIDTLYRGGEEFTFNVIMSVQSIFYTAYALLECFLIGSVVCGTLAAMHKPQYNQDYLIILGCKIRKDGTLYPLIRGRADIAIRFYKEQLEKTGKKAIFIPSGGQGGDEVMAEGEAIARYLREQGIEESQIRVENKSANTKQNMAFSRKIIEAENPDAKAAFCTTNYHVFRSGVIAREADFEPDGMGCPTKWYFWPNAYIRETIGMITYKWKTLVLIFIPIIVFTTLIRFAF